MFFNFGRLNKNIFGYILLSLICWFRSCCCIVVLCACTATSSQMRQLSRHLRTSHQQLIKPKTIMGVTKGQLVEGQADHSSKSRISSFPFRLPVQARTMIGFCVRNGDKVNKINHQPEDSLHRVLYLNRWAQSYLSLEILYTLIVHKFLSPFLFFIFYFHCDRSQQFMNVNTNPLLKSDDDGKAMQAVYFTFNFCVLRQFILLLNYSR